MNYLNRQNQQADAAGRELRSFLLAVDGAVIAVLLNAATSAQQPGPSCTKEALCYFITSVMFIGVSWLLLKDRSLYRAAGHSCICGNLICVADWLMERKKRFGQIVAKCFRVLVASSTHDLIAFGLFVAGCWNAYRHLQ